PPHPNPLPPEYREEMGKTPLVYQTVTIADLARYREVFAGRCYALAELHRGFDDRRDLLACLQKANAAKLPLAAANDVHYHVPERRRLQDVLTAIRHGCTVAELGRRRFPNGERHLKPIAELRAMFALAPGAI